MAEPTVEIRYKPADLPKRMAQFPRKFDLVMKTTMLAALVAVNERVPGYPFPPWGSRYERTYTLGRSLTMGDGLNVHGVKKVGEGAYEGRFGTKVEYAKWVIGEQQAWMHRGRWWTLQRVADRSRQAITKLFDKAMQQMAQFLEGQGL